MQEALNIGFLDVVARWIVLTAGFLFMTALFRDNFILEGVPGFCATLFVLLPLNVALGQPQWLPADIIHSPFAWVVAMSVVNIVILLIMNKALPCLTTTSIWILLFFGIILAAGGYAIGFLPHMPELPFSTRIF